MRELRRFFNDENGRFGHGSWLQKMGRKTPAWQRRCEEMILSTEKQTVDVSAQRVEKAKALLQTPDLCPREWITASKTVIETSCRLNLAFDLEGLIGQAASLLIRKKCLLFDIALRAPVFGRSGRLAKPLLEQN
ncbi:MAG: hypothetical protein R3F23_01205 [Verrucomicrobiia bacterium]